MKNLEITWKGTTPLIMHSCRCVNPLHPLTKGIKVYTGKRTKTDEDFSIMSDYEWFQGAYYTPDDIASPLVPITGEHMLYLPAENVEATIINGGKAFKKGTDIKKFCAILEPQIPFTVPGNPDFNKMATDFKYRDVRQMVVKNNRITRTRPRFD